MSNLSRAPLDKFCILRIHILTIAMLFVLQEGGPASADPAAPDMNEDKQWQSAFISEMSKELGVPSQRLQLLWQ
jgi:hypothetical protein